MEGWMDGWIHRWMDDWMIRWIGVLNRWMVGCLCSMHNNASPNRNHDHCLYYCICSSHRIYLIYSLIFTRTRTRLHSNLLPLPPLPRPRQRPTKVSPLLNISISSRSGLKCTNSSPTQELIHPSPVWIFSALIIYCSRSIHRNN